MLTFLNNVIIKRGLTTCFLFFFMNKFFCCLLLLSATVSAQPVITENNLPLAGTTYLTSTDTTPVILPGTPGPTFQTWDFTSLDSDYTSVPTFDLTSQTQYAADFPASNIHTWGPAALFGGFYGGAPVGTQGYATGDMFWRTDTDGYWIVGFRSDSGTYAGINVYENPRELLIGTPASYGSVFNNTARWELPWSNVNQSDPDTFYSNYVTKTLIADAWGYLQLPDGIGDTVLRIHEYLIRTDSSLLKTGSTIIYGLELYRDTLNNYIYLSKNFNYPLAHVHADKDNNLKTVEFYTGMFVGVKSMQPDIPGVNIYPNPSSCREIYITADKKLYGKSNLTLMIFSVNGQEIFTSSMKDGTFLIDRASIPCDGIYLINLLDGEMKIYDGKMIIKK